VLPAGSFPTLSHHCFGQLAEAHFRAFLPKAQRDSVVAIASTLRLRHGSLPQVWMRCPNFGRSPPDRWMEPLGIGESQAGFMLLLVGSDGIDNGGMERRRWAVADHSATELVSERLGLAPAGQS